MQSFTALTEQNFSDFEAKAIVVEQKARKQELVQKIFLPLQHILALTTILFFGYGVLYECYKIDYANFYAKPKFWCNLQVFITRHWYSSRTTDFPTLYPY